MKLLVIAPCSQTPCLCSSLNVKTKFRTHTEPKAKLQKLKVSCHEIRCSFVEREGSLPFSQQHTNGP
jgi:hypothetical protein